MSQVYRLKSLIVRVLIRNRQRCWNSELCVSLISTLQWRHNGCDGVSNHYPRDCLLNRLFRRRPKKTSKLHVTGLCAGNSPVTGEFPAQRASSAENVSISWRHHGILSERHCLICSTITCACHSIDRTRQFAADRCGKLVLGTSRGNYFQTNRSLKRGPIFCRWHFQIQSKDSLFTELCCCWGIASLTPGQSYDSHGSSAHRIKHYDDVTMSLMASQITSLTIVYSTVYSGADQRKHQSSVSLAFVRRIHRGPVNSPHKWPVTRKIFPFDDVIMQCPCLLWGTIWTTCVISVLRTVRKFGNNFAFPKIFQHHKSKNIHNLNIDKICQW